MSSNRESTKRYKSKHPLIGVWTDMMERCGHHKGADSYKLSRYAGRGIFVCEEWQHLRAFEDWCLANGWKPGLKLDRIDNDGPYAPWNCRFVTHRENCCNRRNNIMFGGKSIVHWYDLGHVEGLSYARFFRRFTSYHWPICRALFEPVHIENQLNPKANSQPR